MSTLLQAPEDCNDTAHHPGTRARAVKPHAFEQAALAALERCALYLIPHLPCETWEELVVSLHCVRRALGLPAPHHPMLDLRDWPDDAQAGDALEVLLGWLDELEHPRADDF